MRDRMSHFAELENVAAPESYNHTMYKHKTDHKWDTQYMFSRHKAFIELLK